MSIRVIFLDVGNADSIIVALPDNTALLIDVPRPRKTIDFLVKRDIEQIQTIYFTHAHHDHFPSWSTLKTFISEWTKVNRIVTLFLPTEALRNAFTLLRSGKLSENQSELLRDALSNLTEWLDEERFNLIRGEYSPYPDQYGSVSVSRLHPDFLYFERTHAENPSRLNDTSLVLRLDYGSFRLLLPADIERSGLSRLLARVSCDKLYCNVLKIPHHGAWPENGDEVVELLEKADPELAILSVGSQNQHGHVVPDLFRELLRLKEDVNFRLNSFICTEVTRTCKMPIIARLALGRRGLSLRTPCAGDIEISIDETGTWQRERQTEHDVVVGGVTFAACRGLAELTE